MSDYPLIEKWLGLEIRHFLIHNFVNADELEEKLAEGFEIYFKTGYEYSDNGITPEKHRSDTHVSLAIGKQPIKKKTQAEAAIELLKEIASNREYYDQKNHKVYEILDKAKEILEMEPEK